MKQPNYLPRSGLLCLCSPHLLEQNLTFHVNFHACPFIHSSAEWTVSAYVFWSHFYSHPCLFMLSVDRLLPVFGVPLCSCQVYFSKQAECRLPQIPSLFNFSLSSFILRFIESERQRADSFFSSSGSRTFFFFFITP